MHTCNNYLLMFGNIFFYYMYSYARLKGYINRIKKSPIHEVNFDIKIHIFNFVILFAVTDNDFI